ncbi:MAG: radical SAM family heme chaperone HemW [Coriobacteriales bacterium]|nr:radical SAM family heme chaperone HemW [Coriobacteriales bacterium]
MSRSGQETSLYIHVPFCVSKCAYCDFASVSGSSPDDHTRFVDAVLAEVRRRGTDGVLDDVVTLYFGGGTPTVLGGELVRLLRGIRELVSLRPDAEITVETNPEVTSTELVGALADAGVNRFSVGVQSFDEDALRYLGRCHDMPMAVRAAAIVHESGLPFSVDLICAIPGQLDGSWMGSVLRAISTGAAHVSIYPLTVEEGTPLAERIARGEAAEPSPDVAAHQMVAASELLEAAGLVRYETANYARPGSESRHNLGYWTGRPYIGIGPSAASMLPLPDGGRRRWTATRDITEWLAAPSTAPHAEDEVLSPAEALREDAMLGLRLRDGILGELAARAGVIDVLVDLEAAGLVEHVVPDDHEAEVAEPDRWRLTDRGWLLGNEVFARVWAGE